MKIHATIYDYTADQEIWTGDFCLRLIKKSGQPLNAKGVLKALTTVCSEDLRCAEVYAFSREKSRFLFCGFNVKRAPLLIPPECLPCVTLFVSLKRVTSRPVCPVDSRKSSRPKERTISEVLQFVGQYESLLINYNFSRKEASKLMEHSYHTLDKYKEVIASLRETARPPQTWPGELGIGHIYSFLSTLKQEGTTITDDQPCITGPAPVDITN